MSNEFVAARAAKAAFGTAMVTALGMVLRDALYNDEDVVDVFVKDDGSIVMLANRSTARNALREAHVLDHILRAQPPIAVEVHSCSAMKGGSHRKAYPASEWTHVINRGTLR